MPIVSVPVAYRGPTQGEGRIRVEGSTVRQCLDAVEALHPGFAELIYDGKGEVYHFLKLFVNDEPVLPGEVEREVNGDDEVTILASVGGG
jgi:hypothetical protein